MADDKVTQQHWLKALAAFELSQEELAEFEQQLSALSAQHLQAESRPGLSNSSKVEQTFYSSDLPEQAKSFNQYSALLKPSVLGTVNTTRPDFVGHMTSALPSFMPLMQKLMAALNQNNVKLETSGYFTDLERQVLAILHRAFYGTEYGDQVESFYQGTMHQPKKALGVFCSGGTLANIMALWVARNRLLSAYGVAEKGLMAALMSLGEEGYQGLAVLVSERGHYSLSKAADVLGIGRENLVAVAVDDQHCIDLKDLVTKLAALEAKRIKVMAIVGVAGATETGSIDDLEALADFAEGVDCHFHVDGAWGGAAIFSQRHRHKLKGIERADSITLDAHKQLYVPMGLEWFCLRIPNSSMPLNITPLILFAQTRKI